MNLNKSGRDELRKSVENLLNSVPNNKKIQLPKETLEKLLFETITINKKEKIYVKIPVWSGDFLTKLDLSQVDFSNVSWTLLDPSYDFLYWGEDIHGIDNLDKNVVDKINTIRTQNVNDERDGFIVNYSGTNANIDLTKSFEAIYFNYIQIRKCNFEGLDFSKINLSGVREIYFNNSTISKTKLTIPKDIGLLAFNSFFTDIDLSDREIDANDYFFGNVYHLSESYLNNTGIQIKLKVDEFENDYYTEDLKEAMNKKWVGCYLNGILLKSQEEKEQNVSKLKEEYETFKQNEFEKILSSIETQKKR